MSECAHSSTVIVRAGVNVVGRLCLACTEGLPVEWGCPNCDWVQDVTFATPLPRVCLGRSCGDNERHLYPSEGDDPLQDGTLTRVQQETRLSELQAMSPTEEPTEDWVRQVTRHARKRVAGLPPIARQDSAHEETR